MVVENNFQKKLTLLFSCGYKIGYQLKMQNLLTIAGARRGMLEPGGRVLGRVHCRVLNLWVVAPTVLTGQAFTLLFIIIAKVQF